MSAPRTLLALLSGAVERYGTKRAALRHRVDGEWVDISHQEMARRIKLLSLGLREMGVSPGDRVAILSHNRPEWLLADFAILMARGVTVPVYPTLPSQQVAHILSDSAASIVFVQDREQYEKVVEVRGQLPSLRWIVQFDGHGDDADHDTTFRAVSQRGAAAEARYPDHSRDAAAIEPDTLASIIYTSGTTGTPKGVMLSHGNFCSNVHACTQVLRIGPDDSCLSFLPLSHSFERTAGQYVMVHRGVTIHYAESFDTLARDMMEVRPTVMTGVPRVYEKIHARVVDSAMSGSALRRRIFAWSRRSALQWADLVLDRKVVPASLAARKALADRLVFSKLRARTGGRIRFLVSGAAPLSPEIARFFFAAGLPVIEGYGLTETSPVIAVNPLDRIRIGTVGPPLPGVEVRIAEDGEIVVRGPNVMLGYHGLAAETASMIDGDGWLHTGDVGEFDEAGYLRITDRKKDVIKTAGGKMVAPQPIENAVKLSKFVANAVLLGDRRRFPIILVVPEFDALEKWSAERGMKRMERAELLKHADVVAKIEREVMLPLRDMASYETPKKIVIIPEDFTIESGELTPTLKVRRKVIEERYRSEIEAAYSEG